MSQDVNFMILQRISDARTPERNCTTLYLNDTNSCVRHYSHRATAAAALLAVKDFNERNPRYVTEFGADSEIMQGCNKRLVPQVLDTGSSGTIAVKNLINSITDEKKEVPVAVVGASRSAASQPVNAVVGGAYSMPQISYGSTSVALDDALLYPSFMRTIPPDSQTAFAICEYLQGIEYSYAGVFYVVDSYGESFRSLLLRECPEVRFLFFSYIDGDMNDVDAKLRSISLSGVNSLIFISTSEELFVNTLLQKAYYEYGVIGLGKVLILTDGVTTSHLPVGDKELEIALNGTIQIVPTGASVGNSRWMSFRDDWNRTNPEDVNVYLPDFWTVDSEFFQNSQYGPDTATVAIFGAFEYDAIAAIGLYACMYDKTENIPEEWWDDWFVSLSANGQTTNMEALEFHGLTGTVTFDANGNRKSSTANYEAHSLFYKDGVPAFYPSQRYIPETTSWETIEGVRMVYNGNADVLPPPLSLVVEDKEQLEQASIFAYVLFVILGGLAIVCGAWAYLNRDYKVVTASQFEFLMLIDIGVLISAATMIPLAIDDENDVNGLAYSGEYAPANAACMASVWLYNLGFVITFVPLFVKMWRVNKLFNNPKLRKIIISNRLLFKIIMVFILVDLSILIPWQVLSPVVYVREVQESDSFGIPTSSVGYCRYDAGSPSIIYITVLQTLHLVYLIGGCVLCYNGRNIETQYQEGKYVTIAIITYLQVLAVSIPVIILSYGEPVVSLIIRIIVITLNYSTVLFCIFYPKMYRLNYLQQTHASDMESIRTERSRRRLATKTSKASGGMSESGKSFRRSFFRSLSANSSPVIKEETSDSSEKEEYQMAVQ